MSDPDRPSGAQAGASPAAQGQPTPRPQPQAVRAALGTLGVPEHGERFWNELESEMEGDAPLQIVPRPAIRPITQPPPTTGGGPPVGDDVFERGGHRGARGGLRLPSLRGGGRSRLIIVAVVAGVFGLAVIGGLFEDRADDDVAAEGDAGQAEELPEDAAPTEDDEDVPDPDEEATETTTTTTEPPGGPGGLLVEDVPMHARGLGEVLQPGTMILDDVERLTDTAPRVDERVFEMSRRCYDGGLPGVEGLTLWMVDGSPDGPETPGRGTLSGLEVRLTPGGVSPVTDAGLRLGSSEEDLFGAYDEPLRRLYNPRYPQGGMYVAGVEDHDYVLVYVTDGSRILEIRAGHEPLVSRPTICS